MRRFVAIIGTICAVLVFASPANAAYSGQMSHSEWAWVDTSIPDSSTQWQVEDHCNCSGEIVDVGTRNGNPTREVRYHAPDDATKGPAEAYIDYVKRDSDGKWHAYHGSYCWPAWSQACDEEGSY